MHKSRSTTKSPMEFSTNIIASFYNKGTLSSAMCPAVLFRSAPAISLTSTWKSMLPAFNYVAPTPYQYREMFFLNTVSNKYKHKNISKVTQKS